MKSFIYKPKIFLFLFLFLAFSGLSYGQLYSAFSSPSSGTHYSYSIGGICVGCAVTNPSYAATTSLTDSTHIYMTVGLFNTISYKLKLTDTARAYAGVMLKSNVALLNLSALDAITLKTYKAGVLQETFNGSSLLSLQLLTGNWQKVEVATTKKFNEVEIDIDNAVSAIWDVNLFYAFGTNFVPLPSNWMYFNAELLKSKDMKIGWATASENNCKGYHVMHSYDGLHYDELGFIPGHGNAGNINEYNYIHMAPKLGTHYYMIEEEDMSGNRTASDVLKKEVVFSDKYETFVRLQPNPVTAELLFESNKPFKTLEVCNNLGQVVFSQSCNNSLSETVNIETLPIGFYYLRAEGDNMSKMIRFMKN